MFVIYITEKIILNNIATKVIPLMPQPTLIYETKTYLHTYQTNITFLTDELRLLRQTRSANPHTDDISIAQSLYAWHLKLLLSGDK